MSNNTKIIKVPAAVVLGLKAVVEETIMDSKFKKGVEIYAAFRCRYTYKNLN